MDTGNTVDLRNILPPEQPPDLLEDTALPVDGLLEAFDKAYAWQQQQQEQGLPDEDQKQQQQQQQQEEVKASQQPAQQAPAFIQSPAKEANRPHANQAAPDNRAIQTHDRQHSAEQCAGSMHFAAVPTGPAEPQQLLEQSLGQQDGAVNAELQSASSTQQLPGVGEQAVATTERPQMRGGGQLQNEVAGVQLVNHDDSGAQERAAATGRGTMPGCPGAAQCQLCGRSAVD